MNSKIKKIGWGFGLCNQRCKHCYNASSMRESIPRYTFAQLKSVADKVCPFIEDINFGTGEFLCNPSALELAEYIADAYPHVDMSVTSNGYSIVAMQPSKIKKLFNDIDISLDFPDKDKHNEFRQHKQAWNWVIESLQILKDLRIQHTIVCCVTSQTQDSDILGLLEMAAKYEANMRINWFRRTGRGTEDLRIDAKRAWEIIRLLADKVVFSSLDSIFAGPLQADRCMPCPAGHLSCRIHQDMSVTAYPFLKGPQWTAGNILKPETTLEDIYDSPMFQRLRNRKVPACAGCPFAKTCAGGCVTRAALHNGSLSQIDDYCPVKANLMDEISNIKVTVHKIGNLVHDGYLCTTIFKPL